MKIEVHHNGQVIETKELGEGSHKIGRGSDSAIQLKSPEVSKHHALLIIKGDKAAIIDSGSANGVFVNGVLVKKQRIKPGDDVLIADFKFVIQRKEALHSMGFTPKEAQPSFNSPMQMGLDMGNLAAELPVEPEQGPAAVAADPLEAMAPQEKLLYLMDEKVLLPVYGLMKAFDWRLLLGGTLIITLVASVLLSVIPIYRWGREIATGEALNRAHTVVRQLVRENYRILVKTQDYSRLTIEAGISEPGMVGIIIFDPKTRTVYAPTKLLNQSVTNIYSIAAARKIVSDQEQVVSDPTAVEGQWVVAQPLYLYPQESNDRQLAAIILAHFDVPDGIYATAEPLVEAILFSILLSLVAYFILMKMISHPIMQMQEQLDSALKGENVTVTCEAKFPELQNLASEINFSVSRWKQLENRSGGGGVEAKDFEAEEQAYLMGVEGFDQGTEDGLLVLDKEKRVKFVGKAMEDLLGMRPQYAIGQNVSEACKDPGFAGTSIELADRVIQNFGEIQFAELDIHGINRNMSGVGYKLSSGELQFILISVKLHD